MPDWPLWPGTVTAVRVTTGSAVRVARAVVTSAAVLSLAAGAHAMGGGNLPAGNVVVALGSFVLLAVTVLSRWHLRLWTLVPALGGIQLALHGALSFLAPGNLSAVADATYGHAHGAGVAMGFAATSDVSAHVHGASFSPSMLLAHAGASVITAVVLVGADQAARCALHWLQSVLPLIRTAAVGVVVKPARTRPAEFTEVVRPVLGLVRSHPRRGPPLAAATA
jgi:hypothetical protein